MKPTLCNKHVTTIVLWDGYAHTECPICSRIADFKEVVADLKAEVECYEKENSNRPN